MSLAIKAKSEAVEKGFVTVMVQVIVAPTVAGFGLHTSVVGATVGSPCVWAEGANTSIPATIIATNKIFEDQDFVRHLSATIGVPLPFGVNSTLINFNKTS